MKKKFLLLVFIHLCFISVFSQIGKPTINVSLQKVWVDSVYATLTPQARIAQLIWPMAEQLNDSKRFAAQLAMVDKYQPGGILFMKNSANDIASFNNAVHKNCKVPFFSAIDAEWGLAMRVKDILPYPKAITLGALANPSTIYLMGLDVAQQLKLLGLNVSFGPVADVNSNPKNPIIGSRSFGEDPYRVAAASVWYMLGMQDGGLLTVAKHFPGHGDTHTDSHLELPLLSHDKSRFDSIELVPFKALIQNGVLGVMSAHLSVPKLDTTLNAPSSLSKVVVTDLLKKELGFEGLVITDAMNMKGVKTAGKPGRVDALALIAGNDVVEATENIGSAIQQIELAIQAGELSWSDIELKCKKVLAMKYRCDAVKYNSVPQVDRVSVINANVNGVLIQQLYDESLTVLSQSELAGNIKGGDSVAILQLSNQGMFLDSISKYVNAKVFPISQTTTYVQIKQVLIKVKNYSRVVCVVDNQVTNKNIWNSSPFGILKTTLIASNQLVCFYTGSPYSMEQYSNLVKVPSLAVMYENNAYVASTIGRYLSGKIESSGQLPVSVGSSFKCGREVVFRYK